MRFHPWRYLAIHHPGVVVRWTALPGDVRGLTDGRTIWMDRRLTQAQRRVVVTHETLHIERGVFPVNPIEESIVERLTAQRLISLPDLLDGLLWCRDDFELADWLWCDERSVRLRREALTPDETSWLDQRINQEMTC